MNRAHFHGPPPIYFLPFPTWIDPAARLAPGEQFEALRLADTSAAIFSDGPFVWLDLSKLDAPPSAPPS